MSTVYLRKDGRYEGRIYYGNNKYISFYGSTRNEVLEKISAVQNMETAPYRHSFKEIFTEWLESIIVNVKESTSCNYRMKAEKHLIPYFEQFQCSDICENDINRFISEKRSEKLSDRYISDMIVVLKSIFKFGERRYKYHNPLHGVKFHFSRSETVKTLDNEQYKQLQTTIAADSSLTSAAISIAMATGLRIGELCALQWKDIDFKKRIITVSKTIQRIKNNQNGDKTKIVITEPKTESSKRIIPLPECLVSVIEKFRNKQNCFLVSGAEKATEPRTLQYRFSKILSNANLPSVHFHSLRHVFATKCLQSGMDIKTLSEILGHSRVETTLNLYVHSSMAHKAEALNNVNLI